MVDQTSPALSQLPTMPTSEAASWPPRAPDRTPGALAAGYSRTPGAALFTPGGIPTVPPAPVAAAATPSPVITPQPPPAAKANPALENGVLPAIATLAAQRRWGAGGTDSGTDAQGQPLAPTPQDSLQAPARAPAAALDPLSGQIHFVDQNSPRTPAPAMPAQIIRAGMVSGEGTGLRNIDAQHMMGLLQPRQTPAEIAQHEILAEGQQESLARMQLDAAQRSGDTTLAKDAQARINAFTHPSRKAYIDQRNRIAFPGLAVPQLIGGGE